MSDGSEHQRGRRAVRQRPTDEERWRRHAGWTAAGKSLGYVIVLLAIYFALPIKDEHWPFGAAVGALAVLAVIPITIVRVRAINVSARPMGEAIQAAALLLALSVTGAATINYGTAMHTSQFPGIETKIDSLYFTVATLATVGYGDIAPTGQGARAMVTVQIIVNFALVATALRLLLGVARERQTIEATLAARRAEAERRSGTAEPPA